MTRTLVKCWDCQRDFFPNQLREVGPRRIQRRRTRGWRMPPNTVSVCRPGKFGNPFVVTDERTQAESVSAFRIWLTVDGCTAGDPERKRQILESLHELRGKNLACFCKEGAPCHADVLLELANKRPIKKLVCPDCLGTPQTIGDIEANKRNAAKATAWNNGQGWA